MNSQQKEILIAGSGPSAFALAHACAEKGLEVLLVSPTMDQRWMPNYACWSDDIASLGLEVCVEASWAMPMVHTSKDTCLDLNRRYAKLSTQQLQTLLRVRASREGVAFLNERVVSVVHTPDESQVELSDGRIIRAKIFVDATGSSSQFLKRTGSASSGYQVAYGQLLEVEEQFWERGEMVLMDYRIPDALSDKEKALFEEKPTFLYVLPLGQNTVFLEETSLVSRPALSMEELQMRLALRLKAMNIRPRSLIDEEKCVIQMGGSRPVHKQRALGFGAAAGLVHPATGYQVATSLTLAPRVAEALYIGLNEATPEAAVQLAWNVIWTKERLRSWDMYQFGMDLMCDLNTKETQDFFDTFFNIPSGLWKGFLSATLPPRELSKAMAHFFIDADISIKNRLLQHSIGFSGVSFLRSVLGFV